MPSKAKFEKYLYAIFLCAHGSYVDVNARELHQIVGNYTHGYDMVLCCKVMRENMQAEDSILTKSNHDIDGPELTIRYNFPRKKPAIITCK